MEILKKYFVELLNLSNEMSPYLLLGFFFAGLLHVYIKQEKITKHLGGKNIKSTIKATLIGIPLPLCSCGVIPTGISLSKNGASKGASVSFLISTPQTGIDSILVSYSMLGLPFAILRPIVALFTGILGGSITNIFDKKNTNYEKKTISKETVEIKGSKIKRLINYAFVEFLQDISKWLLIGLAIAALISILLPDNFFISYINSPILSMLIVLAASIPIYVCATGSVPIAAVLLMKGLSPGAALVFLMAGPATNAATITVIGKSMGNKTLYTYLASIILGALFFGIIIDYLFPSGFFTQFIVNSHDIHSHFLPEWLKLSSTIILGLLILNGFFKKYKKKENTIPFKTLDMKSIKISVNGMTCNHCKMNVEKNISKLGDYESVTANTSSNTVEIIGDNINLKTIEDTVNDLGYEYKGIV